MAIVTPDQWQVIRQIFHHAIELPAGDRESFVAEATAGDPTIQAEIESLLHSYDRSASFIEPPGDSITTTDPLRADNSDNGTRIGRRFGAYAIIREIGHGGMGAVFLGARADEQFRKQVAIKVVRSGMSTEVVLRRFLSERQILADLDHPNIARMLDAGTGEEGLPYFVMEYIEGQSILEYCDSRRLSTEERLKLFREVCSAVHYAHQNLVIHRDIKPSNILVTAESVVKLLDFGIAKILTPGPGERETTRVTERILTPEYASPEQIRGDPLSTASDVYSLGVLLYQLLSGRHPYRLQTESPFEIIRAVCEEDPERPSTAVSRVETARNADGSTGSVTAESVGRARALEPGKLRRRLRGDLDNIVLMAMRKEPQRRYSSVEQLSEDIRRHLQGLPVIARNDTFFYRSGKFVRRHKATVAAGVFIAIALFGGAASTLWEAHIARIQRDKAQNRFNQVRKLANAVLFTYNDGIQKLPGSIPIREVMVRDALEYLDNLSNESGGDLQLERELAGAYRKVGDVQGSMVYGNTGDSAGALESYSKALAIREKIAQSKGSTSEDRRDLANIYIAVARAVEHRGDSAGVLENAEKAAAIFQDLLAANPTDKRGRADVARASWQVASALGSLGRYPEAISSYEKAAAIYHDLAAEDPAIHDHKRNEAVAYKYLGTLLERTRDTRGALDLYKKAVAIDQSLVELDPNDANAKLDLSFSYRSLAKSLLDNGDSNSALENARKALESSRSVAEADPKNAFAQNALAAALKTVGEILAQRGDFAGAIENDQTALKAVEARIKSDQGDSVLKSLQARLYLQIGETYAQIAGKKANRTSQMETWNSARLSFERSVAVWIELRQNGALIKPYVEDASRAERELTECAAAISRLKGR